MVTENHAWSLTNNQINNESTLVSKQPNQYLRAGTLELIRLKKRVLKTEPNNHRNYDKANCIYKKSGYKMNIFSLLLLKGSKQIRWIQYR